MIQKSNATFENLAKIETKQELKQETSKEPIKTISNLSDNAQGGTNYQLANKTAKNATSDGLKWISLVGLFGVIKRKEEKVQNLNGIYEIFTEVKNGKTQDRYFYTKCNKKIVFTGLKSEVFEGLFDLPNNCFSNIDMDSGDFAVNGKVFQPVGIVEISNNNFIF
jgi:hypothetical protein